MNNNNSLLLKLLDPLYSPVPQESDIGLNLVLKRVCTCGLHIIGVCVCVDPGPDFDLYAYN